MAGVLVNRGKFEEATSHYQKALKLHRLGLGVSAAAYDNGNDNQNNGNNGNDGDYNYENASDVLWISEVYKNLGLAQIQIESYERAIASLARSLKLESGTRGNGKIFIYSDSIIETFGIMAIAQRFLNRNEHAISSLNNAVEATISLHNKTHSSLGDIYANIAHTQETETGQKLDKNKDKDNKDALLSYDLSLKVKLANCEDVADTYFAIARLLSKTETTGTSSRPIYSSLLSVYLHTYIHTWY